MNDVECFRFGEFALWPARRRLFRSGQEVALSPRAFDILVALVRGRDGIMEKDALLARVWPGLSVEEANLTQQISLLRKALGDDPHEPRFVATIPRRGYRWVAVTLEEQPPDAWRRPRKAGPTSSRGRLALAGVAATALTVAGVGHLVSGRRAWAPRPPIESLAVLPLENLSGDPAQDYFADGMTEALIMHLARIRTLKVVSRTSVMRFKGNRKPLPAIARELDVDALIEGSVQRAGDRVAIRVQLIYGRTDAHLWARDYERRLADVLELQAEVARSVAEEVRVQVTAEERARMAAAGTRDPTAHQEYLLGRFHLWKFSAEHVTKAIEHFERATAIDPAYAHAYAGLAHAWWVRGVFGTIGLRRAEAPARAAARRALELDDRLAEAHAVQAYLECIYDRDWIRAERTVRRALELDPNNVDAHYTYALLLMALGRSDDALAQIARAAERDPLSVQIHSTFGRILYRARRFDEAASRLNHAIALDPGNEQAHGRLGDVFEQMERFPEALAAYERARGLKGDEGYDARVARVYARMGRLKEAQRILAVLRSRPAGEPLEAAGAYSALGRRDDAFRVLFKSVDTREQLSIFLKQDPPLDRLHDDPRWPVLLSRLKFPQ